MRRVAFAAVAGILLAASSLGAASLPAIEDAKILQLPASARIVVLNFWATWCAPCREEIPALNRLHAGFPDARFVGINLDDPENRGAIPGFLKKFPMTYEVFRRTGRDFKATARALDPEWDSGIPATFLFVDGKRIFSRIGKLEGPELERVLTTLSPVQ